MIYLELTRQCLGFGGKITKPNWNIFYKMLKNNHKENLRRIKLMKMTPSDE